MLYDLIRYYGTRDAARFVGIELGRREVSRLLGQDTKFDVIFAKANARSIWFAWSLAFCPTNLRDSFHIQTWGVFNLANTGRVAEAHRSVFQRRLKRDFLGAAAKPGKKKLTAGQKAARTVKRRLKKLPKHLRKVCSGDPVKLKERARLMKEIIREDDEARQRLAREGRQQAAELRVLHNVLRRSKDQGRVKSSAPGIGPYMEQRAKAKKSS